MTVASFVLTAMTSLAPGRDHHVLANAIASLVSLELPLFANDASKLRTAALLTAIAFRESSLRLDAVGDSGQSLCAFQIGRTSGGTDAMLTDASLCVGAGFAILRTSMRLCPAYPVAWYAAGGDATRACASPAAQRISRDRMALAARLVRDVAAAEVVKPAPTGLRTPIDAASRRWDLDPRDLLPLRAVST